MARNKTNALFYSTKKSGDWPIEPMLEAFSDINLKQCHTENELLSLINVEDHGWEVILLRQGMADSTLWSELAIKAKHIDRFIEIIIIVSDDNEGEFAQDVLGDSGFGYFVYSFNPHVLAGYVRAAASKSRDRRQVAEFSEGLKEASALKDVYSAIKRYFQKFIEYDCLTLLLFNDLAQHFKHLGEPGYITKTLATHDGYSETRINWKFLKPLKQDPILNEIVRSRRPFIWSDLTTALPSKWDKDLVQGFNTRSWIALPLFYRSTAIGIILLEHRSKGFYELDKTNLLELLGNEAAIAIKNVERVEIQTALATAVEALVDRSLTLEAVCRNISQQVCSVTGAIYSYVAGPREHGVSDYDFFEASTELFFNDLRAKVKRFPPREHPKYKAKGITRLAGERKQSVLLNDIRNDVTDSEFDQEARNAYMDYRDTTRSDLAVPILDRNHEILGIINIEHERPFSFTEEHLKAIELFAKYAAVAMQMVHIEQEFERQEKQLLNLQTMTTMVNLGGELNGLLHNLIDKAVSLLNVSDGGIYLDDPQHNRLELIAHHLPDMQLQKYIKYDDGLSGRLIHLPKQRIMRVADYSTWDGHIPENASLGVLGSLIGIRLETILHIPIGVLWVNSPAPHDYSQRDERLLIALADQAAGMITLNALWQDLQSSIKETSMVKQQGNKVFIIHGRDENNRQRLRTLLKERFNLEPIILQDISGGGRTIIEKLEDEASTAIYAFALLTPDDVVKEKTDQYLQARPNVMIEIGWFYGRLGRSRVCLVQKIGTEVPTDLQGVNRVTFADNVDEAYLQIEGELRNAGVIA